MKQLTTRWSLYFLIGAIILLNGTSIMASSAEVVTVNNLQELWREVGSDRTILLMPGEYQLSGPTPTPDTPPNPYLSWEQVGDEYQLVLQGVQNLSLIGDQAEVSSNSSQVTVLTIRDSHNVQIQGLRMGIDSEQDGQGAILEVENCTDIKVGGALLYGAGSYGLILHEVDGFKLTESIIVDAADGVTLLTDSHDVSFTNNTIWNNKGGMEIGRSTDVWFRDNEFLENQIGNQTFFRAVESSVLIQGAIMKRNQGQYLLEYAGCAILEDWVDEENQFAELYRKDLEEEFFTGVKTGILAKVKYAVRNGFEPSQYDQNHRTPLNLAVDYGHVSVAKYLIEKGLAVNNLDYQGFTPLCYAAAYGKSPKMIETLVAAGGEVNGEYHNFTPLILAASMNPDPEITRTLIAAGATVDMKNTLGGTALLYAAKNGKYPANLRVLAENGADVNLQHVDQTTPLMYAAESNDTVGIIQALVELGAEVNAQNQYGRTALTYAIVRDNSPAVIKSLLDLGADPTLEDQYGVTGLKYIRLKKDELKDTEVWATLTTWGQELEEDTTTGGEVQEVSAEIEGTEEESAEIEGAEAENTEAESEDTANEDAVNEEVIGE